MNSPVTSFDGLGLAPGLMAQLDKLGFTTPTPIQAKAIPVALEGSDVIGIAQTGTGKTLAFGLPMLQRLAGLPDTAQGLILLPTRELAEQVEMNLKKIAPGLPIALIIGGASIRPQISAMQRRPKIIIATPGRLIDLMQERVANLKNVAMLVLDEADRMLDMGFAPQIQRILDALPRERQTMLFSATMPSEIAKIATTHMQLPLRVEVAPAGTANERVEQEVVVVPRDQKSQLLEKILGDYSGSVLVFSRTKHGAKKLARLIRAMGHAADEIHADRSQAQRRNALAGFKSGKYRVLVATDIAARGIDVTGIELVINFDLPDNPEDYVHRIGRTGRAGHAGTAISFATPDQAREVNAIERVLRTRLEVSHAPADLPALRAMPKSEPQYDPYADRVPDHQTRRQSFARGGYGSSPRSGRGGGRPGPGSSRGGPRGPNPNGRYGR